MCVLMRYQLGGKAIVSLSGAVTNSVTGSISEIEILLQH